MINIISTFYVSKYSSDLDELRTQELISALKNNIDSEYIEKIHLFVDDEISLNKLNEIAKDSNKIKIIELKKQPIYTDFFNYILNNLPDKICMITNSDIYLHSCDISILDKLKDNKYLYVLTRHEYDMSHYLIDNYSGSHDCYIFNSKYLDNTIINEHTQYKQNLPGIESQIISSFCKSGFKAFNPCKQIKIVHLHKTHLRNYSLSDWIGLHKYADDEYFSKNCWCVPPIFL